MSGTYTVELRPHECKVIRIQDVYKRQAYGFYELGKTWDEVFDWTNDKCNETIFAFPSSYGDVYKRQGMYSAALKIRVIRVIRV